MFKSINCLCLLACAVAYVACSSDSGTAVPQQASSYDEPDSSYEGSSSLYDSRDGCGSLCGIGYSSNSMGGDHFNSLSVSSTSSSISSPSETCSSSSSYTQPISYGTLVDTRDGQTYKTVVIGSQTWMAENLNYETENSYCYTNESANSSKYGRFYDWYAAMEACPNGWHLPSKAEFETLVDAVGGSETRGGMLKSTDGWSVDGNGTDAFGFSALPVGLRNTHGLIVYEGLSARFWSSTEGYSDGAYYMDLYYGTGYAELENFPKGYGFSVRCLRDEVANSGESSTSSSSSSYTQPISYGTFVDTRDGQAYKTVVIGSQTWMAENLNYETADSYCYDNAPTNCEKYGRLYDWYAAMEACPNGWHLPTEAEFETLFDAVGGVESAGRKLKSTGGWIGAGNGTDAFGFSALPAGFKFSGGSFNSDGHTTGFWSSTGYSSNASVMSLGDSGLAYLHTGRKSDALSVRCLRD